MPSNHPLMLPICTGANALDAKLRTSGWSGGSMLSRRLVSLLLGSLCCRRRSPPVAHRHAEATASEGSAGMEGPRLVTGQGSRAVVPAGRTSGRTLIGPG